MNDTIYALATARGRAGIAVIRISGPDSARICAEFCGKVPATRRASLVDFTWAGKFLDQGIVILFEKGSSFTGETIVEFHIHGSRAVERAFLHALAETGARMAGPGEFTQRALENGMLDLTQVEGLADLIDAETEAQRQQALRTMTGEISRKVNEWRQQLVRAAALLEACIDFSEEDIPENVIPEIEAILDDLSGILATEIAAARKSEQIREGFEVAIIGPPNVGKSTLLNRLAGREAAITSDIAGTTRDVIEVRMEIDGHAVTLLDTAGLRDGGDPVEREGIRRALERALQADLRIFLGQAGTELLPQKNDLIAQPKADLGAVTGLAVSGKTGLGIERLISEISERLRDRVSGAGLMIRERHRLALEKGLSMILAARDKLAAGNEIEIVAEDLRLATRAMDALIGRVDTEDLLGEIFASFCIGK